MKEALETLIRSTDKTQEQLLDAMNGIFSAARAGAVYSEPIQVGDCTVITASEVVAGGGFGFGRGLGAGPERHVAETDGANAGTGVGGGGGGGGGSTARPVAVILVGPDGPKVQPVVDVTKIALAALTAWALMVPTLVRIARARKG